MGSITGVAQLWTICRKGNLSQYIQSAEGGQSAHQVCTGSFEQDSTSSHSSALFPQHCTFSLFRPQSNSLLNTSIEFFSVILLYIFLFPSKCRLSSLSRNHVSFNINGRTSVQNRIGAERKDIFSRLFILNSSGQSQEYRCERERL